MCVQMGVGVYVHTCGVNYVLACMCMYVHCMRACKQATTIECRIENTRAVRKKIVKAKIMLSQMFCIVYPIRFSVIWPTSSILFGKKLQH